MDNQHFGYKQKFIKKNIEMSNIPKFMNLFNINNSSLGEITEFYWDHGIFIYFILVIMILAMDQKFISTLYFTIL
jgi:hypothetical protein